MATINATLSVTSDISDYGLAINNTMTMKKAGLPAGLELTTGLAKKAFTNTNQVDLLTAGAGIAADVTASKAAKVYIKNVGTDPTVYFTIGFGNASTGTTATVNDNDATFFELGRLYGQDWMIIPWIATSTTGDICIQPSAARASDPVHVEYMVFFE
tara:strand:- start:2728 stop:3198 length:471 start_codon:yes stop_codon:yes gene_type:complete